MLNSNLRWTMLSALLGATVLAAGCAESVTPESPADAEKVPAAQSSDQKKTHDHGEGEEGGAHDGWWCVEHGVPEEECALCRTDLIADFKAKDDWCEEHDRPQSQCFKCDPSLFEKFAARYEAKFGKQPPKPTE